MLSMSNGGSTRKTEAFLDKMIRGDLYSGLDSICQAGVSALAGATPRDSGATADSWSYEIDTTKGVIWWNNSNLVGGFSVAVGLQYGHGTGSGGWVEGYDYVNPSLRPIFDMIAEAVWKEVQRA